MMAICPLTREEILDMILANLPEDKHIVGAASSNSGTTLTRNDGVTFNIPVLQGDLLETPDEFIITLNGETITIHKCLNHFYDCNNELIDNCRDRLVTCENLNELGYFNCAAAERIAPANAASGYDILLCGPDGVKKVPYLLESQSTESLHDLVAAMFQAGSHTNASVTYDDNSGTLNITAMTGGGAGTLTQEEVEDFVGRLVVQGTGINVTYDDAGNVLRIALAGESYTTAEKNKLAGIAEGATKNATDAALRDRSTHTGTQPIASVSGLQAALDSLSGRISAVETSGPAAPVMLTAPTVDPEIVIRGDQVTFTLGTWSAGTPVGTLMQGGVNRTGEIIDGQWTPSTVGDWTWAVTNGAAEPHVTQGTVTLPQAITVNQTGPFMMPTVMEDQTYSQPLSALFGSPYTLTYTLSGAPSGVTLSGGNIIVSDTVAAGSHVFTVTATDRYNQTASIVINMTVQALPDGQTLAISYEPDATMTIVVEGGTVTINLTEPEDYAGSYTVATSDFAAGPVWIVAPTITSTGGLVDGGELTIKPGLFVSDAAHGNVTRTRQMYRGETPIPETAGATSYTITAEDEGYTLTCRETATDSAGTRTTISNAVEIVVPGAAVDTFTAPNLTRLRDYTGESGIPWDSASNNGNIEDGFLRNAAYVAHLLHARMGNLGPDQFAEADMVLGTGDDTAGLALRITGNTGYYVRYIETGWWVHKLVGGVVTNLTTRKRNGIDPTGTLAKARFEVQGTTLRLFVHGELVWTGEDSDIATGEAGAYFRGGTASRLGTKIDTFHAGNL